jgi:hypothetical protein
MAAPSYPSLRFNFTSTYRGGSKQWSMRWFFRPGVPADLTAWTALINAIKVDVRAIVSPSTQLDTVDCLVAGTEVPLHTVSVSQAGTFVVSGRIPMPLETCMLARWGTDARTSKNHPIYLFNYVHDVYRAPSETDHEKLDPDQRGSLDGWLTRSISGYSDGSNVYHRCGPNGASATTKTLPTYFTHRDFPA